MTAPLAAEPCEFLTWDTDFFGIRIARVNGETLSPDRVEQIDAWCREHAIGCLYFLADPEDKKTVQLAQTNGYQLVDVRTTLVHIPSPMDIQAPAGPARLRPARIDDIPSLQNSAANNHTDTRYFQDPGFPQNLSCDLYRVWISKSVRGYAEHVLVATLDGDEPVGYITCHLAGMPPTGKIGLLGVDVKARGKDTGRTLVLGALKWFASQGAAEVSVVTQDRNMAALHLYGSCGFTVRLVRNSYHKWYEKHSG